MFPTTSSVWNTSGTSTRYLKNPTTRIMKINEPAGIKEYPALNTIPESAKQIAKLNIMFALANLYLVAGKFLTA